MGDYSTFGRHVALEAICNENTLLDDIDELENIAKESVHIGGAGLISHIRHRAEGRLSLLFLLSESHFSIYIDPYKRAISLDCYTCGERVDPDVIVSHFLSYLTPKIVHREKLIRGIGKVEVE